MTRPVCTSAHGILERDLREPSSNRPVSHDSTTHKLARLFKSSTTLSWRPYPNFRGRCSVRLSSGGVSFDDHLFGPCMGPCSGANRELFYRSYDFFCHPPDCVREPSYLNGSSTDLAGSRKTSTVCESFASPHVWDNPDPSCPSASSQATTHKAGRIEQLNNTGRQTRAVWGSRAVRLVLTAVRSWWQERVRQEGREVRSRGSRGSRQPDKAQKNWGPHLTETRRSSEVKTLGVT